MVLLATSLATGPIKIATDFRQTQGTNRNILNRQCSHFFSARFPKMAPLHHHFEMKGWSEPQVVVRFWIIGILSALAAFATLKLR